MSKRDTRINREIEKLRKEDKENTKLIKNLKDRNDFLAAENITLNEKDEYRQYMIENIEQLLKEKEEEIKVHKETLRRMKATWKMQTRLVMIGYIVFVLLMCIAIA